MIEDRSKGIGLSEMAAALGVSLWKTPLRLWAEKTGRLPIPDLSDTDEVEMGLELENIMARWFTKKTGFAVRKDRRTFYHPNYPFIYGHIDRRVVKQDAVLEIKTMGVWQAKKWEGINIPIDYVIQLNGYLGLLEKSIGYFAYCVGGQRRYLKQIQFDKELYEKSIEGGVNFWENFVLKDIPPVATLGDDKTLFELFPQSIDKIVTFGGTDEEHLNALIEERQGGIQSIKLAEEELEKIENQIKQYLGEAEAGETSQYRITWKTQKRQYADTEAMKQAGIWNKYSKETQFRALRIKQKGLSYEPE